MQPCSLFTDEEHKRSARDVFDTFATQAGLVYDVTNNYILLGTKWQHLWASVFMIFQTLILTKQEEKSNEKLLCMYACFWCSIPIVDSSWKCIHIYPILEFWSTPIRTSSETKSWALKGCKESKKQRRPYW